MEHRLTRIEDGYSSGGTTVVSAYRAAVSLTVATLPSTSLLDVPTTAGRIYIETGGSTSATGGVQNILSIPPYQVLVAPGTVVLYPIANSAFTTSTNAAYGHISARIKED